MRKRNVLLFLIGFFAFACLPALADDAILFSTWGKDNAVSVSSLAVAGDTLYIAASKQLYDWRVGEKEPVPATGEISGTLILIGQGDQLYGLDTSNGHLFSLPAEGGQVYPQERIALDWEIMQTETSYQKIFYGAVMTPSSLFLLVEGENDPWARDLYAFSLDTGKAVLLPLTDVQAIAPYIGDSIVYAAYSSMELLEGSELFTYNIKSGKSDMLLALPDARVEVLAYDTASSALYMEAEGKVFGWTYGKEAAIVTYLPASYSAPRFAGLLPPAHYVSLIDDKGIYIRSVDGSQGKPRALHVGGQIWGSDMNPAFDEAHPEIPVTHDGFLDKEVTIAQLISGAGSDLYILDASSDLFNAMRDKGYAMDLSGNTFLKAEAERMYPSFAAHLYNDAGDLIAFPYEEIQPHGLHYAYNPAVLKQLGISKAPRTVEEMIDLYVTWAEHEEWVEEGFMLKENTLDLRWELLQLILSTYVTTYEAQGKALTFDTPLFRSLLEKWEAAGPALDALKSPGDSTGAVEITNEYLDHLLLEDYTPLLRTDYDPYTGRLAVMPLSLDATAEPVISSTMMAFIINPASQNVDLAMTYIQTYAEHMDAVAKVQYYPDQNDPVENPQYEESLSWHADVRKELMGKLEAAAPEERKTLEAQLKEHDLILTEEIEKRRWDITAQSIAEYRALAPYIQINTWTDVTLVGGPAEAIKLLKRYLDGQMDMEQFIDQYDRLVQMILAEGK